MENIGRKDMDERSIILEQDRLARERKRRKNRKKKRIAGGVVLFLALGGVWYLLWGRTLLNTEEETVVQVMAQSGQRIIYAKLDSVKGNEISYTLARQQETEADADSNADVDTEGGSRPDRGSMPDMSSMEGSGEMPDRNSMGGWGGGMAGQTNQSADSDTFTYNEITYKLTEESATAIIPVGTDVTTRLGTVTTFSRLKAGDYIALVIEEVGGAQVITAVYIVG